jgi:hypothetical protein
MQFKHIKKPDWLEEEIKKTNPELFKRLYGWKYENRRNESK